MNASTSTMYLCKCKLRLYTHVDVSREWNVNGVVAVISHFVRSKSSFNTLVQLVKCFCFRFVGHFITDVEEKCGFYVFFLLYFQFLIIIFFLFDCNLTQKKIIVKTVSKKDIG